MNRMSCIVVLTFTLSAGSAAVPAAENISVTIGSKAFTESVILGEMLTQLASIDRVRAGHRRELGGTRVVWNALLSGEIDAYVEYTGTLTQEILASEKLQSGAELERALAALGVSMTEPLGFNNTYALGIKDSLARRHGLRSISDLRKHPEFIFGFSNEFLDRGDGWPGLRRRYGLPQHEVRGMDHDLAYRGLDSGAVQVTDLYSTDAEIPYYDLRILDDDLHYFPEYQAVILYRTDLTRRAPRIVRQFIQLAGRIDSAVMATMNARAKLEHVSESVVAADFLQRQLSVSTQAHVESAWQRLRRHTAEHLLLVAISLGAAIFVSIPLGIIAARRARLGQIILGVAGILQTIPSLALFVFMIPLLGIGGPPAVVALFLYSLLPIMRNTYSGLKDIDPALIDSARVLGLPPGIQLWRIELPLSARTILAGIKTSAVINVGTATLGALIGAGGYGQPILTGIRLDDIGLILQGAVPAAALALLVQGAFELAERAVVPRGLRLGATSRI